LSVIAADSMEGRAAGSAGALRAQRYIEREIARIGLDPSGENGTYEQPLRSVRRHVGRSEISAASVRFSSWNDFVPIPWAWKAKRFREAQTIYGGVIGDSLAADVAGKFVILKQPQGRTVIPRIGPGDPLNKAAAVAIVGLEKFAPQRLAPVRAGLSAGLEGNSMMRVEAPASLLVTTSMAEALLGRSISNTRPGALGQIVTASISFDDSVETTCCNIIAVLPGQDPQLSREFVAVSAHLDHIGVAPVAVDHDSLRAVNEKLWDRGRGIAAVDAPPNATASIAVDVDSLHRRRPVRRDSIFNGADDDGSGSVAVLEIARALAGGPRPRRSILFVWHTAEELGNEGSTWFTDHPTVPRDSIIALLHLDMVGRGSVADLEGGGPRYLEIIGARRLAHRLGDVIEAANTRAPFRFKLDYRHDSPTDPMHLYCRSDHFEYARYGIPIAFFTTGEHADYHQVTDEIEYIDFGKLANVSALVERIALQLANDSTRLSLDGLKPDPSEGCQG
jgi:hypothetical protein